MTIDIAFILICFALPVATALSGLYKAYKKGEKIDWIIFTKTLVIGIVTAGFITQIEGELIVAIFSTEMFTVVLDWIFNAILNKTARTAITKK